MPKTERCGQSRRSVSSSPKPLPEHEMQFLDERQALQAIRKASKEVTGAPVPTCRGF